MSPSLLVVREGLLRKNCRSFGLCPNYLSFFAPSWLILTFNGTKINLINDGCRCLTTESDFPNFFLVDNTIEFVQSVDYKKKTYFATEEYTYYKENKPSENETPKVRYALEDFQ